MKKILGLALIVFCTFLSACNNKPATTNRIYVFYQEGCIHCQHAKTYMDRYYKNYDIKELDIHKDNNISHLLRYARKYKIPQQDLGTPLIIIGDQYIMGWGREQEMKFNRYAKNFKPIK